MSLPLNILLVGCGAMGAALYEKWRGSAAYNIAVVDPSVPWAHPSCDDLPLDFSPSFIVFAVKPQTLPSITAPYHKFAHSQCVFVSIAAGLCVRSLQRYFPSQALVVRAMPNLPATVGHGLTALMTDPRLTPDQKENLSSLFTVVGQTVWVDNDSQIDTITALSGSGPAYFFCLAQALIKAGIEQGLPASISSQVVYQTLIGSGALAKYSGLSFEKLRQLITSPQGTTEAALKVFDHENTLDILVHKAVCAAIQRAQEMAAP